jgi:ATP-dependent Clp protease ATP-binding subunit ClpA
MSNILDTPVRAVVKAAEGEARAARCNAVEAEHLLLALASALGTAAHDVLASAGLTHDAVCAGLVLNSQQSLAAAGVTWDGSPVASPAATGEPSGRGPGGRLKIGSSAKLALSRASSVAKSRRDGRLDSSHVLVGVLQAEVGTVPRALAAAGVNRPELLAAALAVLDEAR